MARKTFSPFGSTRALQGQMDEFLDKVSEGGLVFQRGLVAYLDDKIHLAEEKLGHLTTLEARCDELRRSIESTLYTEMLIPESRGDVLQLLGDLDDLLDGFKQSMLGFVVELPEVPADCRDGFAELGSNVEQCSEFTVRAARAFFRDDPTIRDFIHKVGFFEAESDAVALRLRQRIFSADLPLARKMHLRDAIGIISGIADAAEDCGDRMTIYAIKRTL